MLMQDLFTIFWQRNMNFRDFFQLIFFVKNTIVPQCRKIIWKVLIMRSTFIRHLWVFSRVKVTKTNFSFLRSYFSCSGQENGVISSCCTMGRNIFRTIISYFYAPVLYLWEIFLSLHNAGIIAPFISLLDTILNSAENKNENKDSILTFNLKLEMTWLAHKFHYIL